MAVDSIIALISSSVGSEHSSGYAGVGWPGADAGSDWRLSPPCVLPRVAGCAALVTPLLMLRPVLWGMMQHGPGPARDTGSQATGLGNPCVLQIASAEAGLVVLEP